MKPEQGRQNLEEAVGKIEIPPDLSPGTRIDERYELLEPIGRGAHGIVFKARHIFLDDFVAIKFLDPGALSGERAEARFHKEAQLLSTLSHPNIVKFHAFGKAAGGRQFIALELLQGLDLSSLFKQKGPLTEAEALPIFVEICKALDYAHSHGIIHRDVKPSNVILSHTDTGEIVKLLDFGIFKEADSAKQSLTATGIHVGSPNYMSPEQCKFEKLDQRSDIYSLGCLMYEALTGEAPMTAESELVVLSNHINKSIITVPAKYGISRELETAIIRCLKKNPDERFACAAELLNALESAREKPLLRRHANGSRKLSILAAIAVLLVGGILSIRQWRESVAKTTVPTMRQKEYRNDRQPAPSPNLPKYYSDLNEWLEEKLHAVSISSAIGPAIYDNLYARARLGIKSYPAELERFSSKLADKIERDGRYRVTGLSSALEEKSCLSLIDLSMNREAEAETIFKELESIPANREDITEINKRKQLFFQTMTYAAWLSTWRGNFQQARAFANRATKTLPTDLPSSNLALLCQTQANTDYMEGKFSKAKEQMLKAAAIDIAASKSAPTLDNAGLCALIRFLNEYKQYASVIQLCEWSSSKSINADRAQENAFMQTLLLEARLKSGKKSDIDSSIEIARTRCRENWDRDDYWDELECLILGHLKRSGKSEAEVLSEAMSYLQEQQKPGHEARYINAVARICDELSQLKIQTAQLQLNQLVSEYESAKKVACECAEIRIRQALKAMEQRKESEALDYLKLAKRDLRNRSSERAKYLRTLAACRQMQVLATLNKLDELDGIYTELVSEKLIDDSKEDFDPAATCSENLSFLAIDIIARARVKSGQYPKAIRRHRRLFHGHKGVCITMLDDYAGCGMALASEFESEHNFNEAIETLETCLKNLELYRAWEIGERSEVMSQLIKTCDRAGKTDKSGQIKRKLEMLKSNPDAIDPSMFDSDFYSWLRAKY